MPYYDSGDLIHYITKDFFNIRWYRKLENLRHIAYGLEQVHELNIIHRDFHSGNIFFNDRGNEFINRSVTIGDLGISKSATESGDDKVLFLIWLQRFCKDKNIIKLQIFIVLE